MSERVRLMMPTRANVGGQVVSLPDGVIGTVESYNGEFATILIGIQVPREHLRTEDFKEGSHE